jgi:hypothetical protein
MSIVQFDREYNVTYPGTIPKRMRYQLDETSSSDEGIVLSIHYR